MPLNPSIAKRLLPRMRRYLGMNFVRVMRDEAGELRRAASQAHRGLHCRVLSEREVLAFAADPQLELAEQWVRGAFARGAVCLGALQRGRLLGYTWLAFGDTPYASGVWVGLDAQLRYSHKSFVRPECRGQRIIQALHALGDRPELWRGRRASVNFVEADNFASLAALERAGARTVGYATYAKIFGTVVAFRSPGVRRAGIRFYARAPRR
jgi:GNAT superfamily N-acetyltransferase